MSRKEELLTRLINTIGMLVASRERNADDLSHTNDKYLHTAITNLQKIILNLKAELGNE